MRALVQRVKGARVVVEDRPVSDIGSGLLVFLGVGKDDGEKEAQLLAKKIAGLRIFEDENQKMNLNVGQANCSILSVPQFTLYADTRRGNRPGFDSAAGAQKAEALWKKFNKFLRSYSLTVKEGVFGARMQVELVNDGPVTIWLDSATQP